MINRPPPGAQRGPQAQAQPQPQPQGGDPVAQPDARDVDAQPQEAVVIEDALDEVQMPEGLASPEVEEMEAFVALPDHPVYGGGASREPQRLGGPKRGAPDFVREEQPARAYRPASPSGEEGSSDSDDDALDVAPARLAVLGPDPELEPGLALKPMGDLLPADAPAVIKAAAAGDLAALQRLAAQGHDLTAGVVDSKGLRHNALTALVVLGGSRLQFEACARFLLEQGLDCDFNVLRSYLAKEQNADRPVEPYNLVNALPVLARLVPGAAARHAGIFAMGLNCVVARTRWDVDMFELTRNYVGAGVPVNVGAQADGVFGQATPLQIAALHWSPQAIDCLLEAGADPHVTNPEGDTVLMSLLDTADGVLRELGEADDQATIAADLVICVELLVHAGVDTQARNQEGLTFLDMLTRWVGEHCVPAEDDASEGAFVLEPAAWTTALTQIRRVCAPAVQA